MKRMKGSNEVEQKCISICSQFIEICKNPWLYKLDRLVNLYALKKKTIMID